MWNLVFSGGFMMVPLLASSVLLIAILIERYWFFRNAILFPDNLLEDVQALYKKSNGYTKKDLMLLQKHSLLGVFFAYMLDKMLINKQSHEEVLNESLDFIAFQLEKYLTTLGILAAIAPLMGLLGTIFGIIKIFSKMLLDAATETHLLASGIAEALITTATGLLIAIPSIIFYRLLLRKIDHLLFNMNKYGKKFLSSIKK